MSELTLKPDAEEGYGSMYGTDSLGGRWVRLPEANREMTVSEQELAKEKLRANKLGAALVTLHSDTCYQQSPKDHSSPYKAQYATFSMVERVLKEVIK